MKGRGATKSTGGVPYGPYRMAKSRQVGTARVVSESGLRQIALGRFEISPYPCTEKNQN